MWFWNWGADGLDYNCFGTVRTQLTLMSQILSFLTHKIDKIKKHYTFNSRDDVLKNVKSFQKC